MEYEVKKEVVLRGVFIRNTYPAIRIWNVREINKK